MTGLQASEFDGERWNLGAYQSGDDWHVVVREERNTELVFTNYYDLYDWSENI